MTKFYIYLLFFVSSFVYSQTRKTFNDHLFKKGDIIKMPEILWVLDGNGHENDSTLKLMSSFINSHKNLRFEIGSHTDARGKAINNYTLSSKRAENIRQGLIDLYNVDPAQLTYKGYANSIPLVKEVDISKAKTRVEKEALHQKNRRTELKVIQVQKSFNDTLFEIGDIIKIPEIIYDLSLPCCGQDQRDTLKLIADFLNSHKKIIVELGCYTDNRGAKEGNIKLSQFRGSIVQEYLVKELEVDSTRIKYKGYGPNGLLITDKEILKAKTQEQKEILHQKNRRTELKVIGLL